MFITIIIWILIGLACLKIIAIITCGWCKSNVCLNGRTAIVTGGNSGIGLQIALGLASRGCRVIIADKDDGTASVQKIIKETHNTNIAYRNVDLCSFNSIRKFVKDIIATEKSLHILINNAGIAATNLVLTEDGIQRTMQVNYFGPFLLTYLLTDLLKKSAPSRIVFVTSYSAIISTLSLETLNPTDTTQDVWGIYQNSKFCDLLAAIGFGERLKGTGVTANCVCPGAVNSQIYASASKEQGSLIGINFLSFMSKLYGKTPQEGAQAAIYLACANEVENSTGQFYKDCKRMWILPLKAYSRKFRQEIWNETERLVKLQPNEKTLNSNY